jgi:VWFA-related protein
VRTLCLLLAGAVVLEAGAQEPRPTFSVNVEGVQVDVLAASRGRPLTGLTADDFELRDNGVRQRIDTVVQEDVPLDVFLVLDTSGSVIGEPLAALADAARTVVDALSSRDRIALLAFGYGLTGFGPLTSDKAVIHKAIDDVRASGSTPLVDAVYAALALRTTPNSSATRALVIAFTDGRDTSSWLVPSAVLDVAWQTDVVVYSVALAQPQLATADVVPFWGQSRMPPIGVLPPAPERDQPPAFLEELASITGGRLLRTGSPNRLRDAFAQALREMKTRYVLTYTPQGVEREGWHTLDVRLTRSNAEVTARRGYFVPSAR